VNEKEARELITKVWPEEFDPVTYGEARGYLVAIEKANPVVEMLKKYRGRDDIDHEVGIVDTLAKWEKEK